MKALIAMSGGVDSSVAAYLMKEKGYDCAGITMKLYDLDEPVCGEKTCCSFEDIEDAKTICGRLGMLYEVADFRSDFEGCVITPFISEYENGRTPNPCIECNRTMKFKKLYALAMERGFDTVVTGHYARVSYNEGIGRYQLRKGVDLSKDQSYVLYMMTQEELSHLMFPDGDYDKVQIREIAEREGFINARKHDSQDICFIPDGDYAGFLERRHGAPYPRGSFVDYEGNVLGEHKGIIHYTVGQRKGLGIPSTEPYYVCEIRPEANEIVLGRKDELGRTEVTAKDFNWLSIASPAVGENVSCTAKIRYSHRGAAGGAVFNNDGTVTMCFEEPVYGVAKGQALVLYDGDLVLGGGVIV